MDHKLQLKTFYELNGADYWLRMFCSDISSAVVYVKSSQTAFTGKLLHDFSHFISLLLLICFRRFLKTDGTQTKLKSTLTVVQRSEAPESQPAAHSERVHIVVLFIKLVHFNVRTFHLALSTVAVQMFSEPLWAGCRWFRSAVCRWRDSLLSEEWKQLGSFPSQPIRVRRCPTPR